MISDAAHAPRCSQAELGPGGMKCGASVRDAQRHPEAMLQHPFQALACVRQAAAARGITISSWDRPWDKYAPAGSIIRDGVGA
jgi:hypothetical protein